MKAIRIYLMMTNLLPKASVKDIHKLQCNFIWGDTEIKKKHHTVSLENITLSKCDGALGLRKLGTMNHICIMKLGGRIMNGEEDLSCRVLKGKYKVVDVTKDFKVRRGDSNLWKAIVKNSPTLLECGKWNIGNDGTIKAWEDCWVNKCGCIMERNLVIPAALCDMCVCDLVENYGD